MNLLEKHKAQNEALEQHKLNIAAFGEAIKKAHDEIKEIWAEKVDTSDIISEALEDRGIYNYYFYAPKFGTESRDSATRLIAIDGVTCEVTVSLIDGTLLIKEIARQVEELQAA